MDLVAIPDFSCGAMENWGLVTYRTMNLLYDEQKSSSKAKQQVAYVVDHELAHQWFGNLGNFVLLIVSHYGMVV
jgi:aminopeptidase 2